MERDPLTGQIIGAAIAVHRAVGPGLLESVYQRCLAAELRHVGLRFVAQPRLPLVYREVRLPLAFRMDFDIEEQVVVELKACEVLIKAHRAQVLTYLRLSGRNRGLLINFHASPLHLGVERFVMG